MASCPRGVTFDGTNDRISRGADLSGDADGSQGTVSMWLDLAGGDAANLRMLGNLNGKIAIRRDTGNKIRVDLFDAAGTSGLQLITGNSYVATNDWIHILSSWDVNFSVGSRLHHLYISDVSDESVFTDTGSAFSVDYTQTNWFVGGDAGPSALLNGDLADVWFANNIYFDLSVESNRRKFISSSGGAVDLGADGSLPTGSAPIVFLRGPASTFPTNLGTGGDFTVTGALDDSATDPPCSIVGIPFRSPGILVRRSSRNFAVN